jgi:hypothetical protein
MNAFRSFLPLLSILAVVGCAAPDESVDVSDHALEGAPRITADELAAKAEAHFNEVEASDPHVSQAPATVLFAIDDDAPVLAEGAQLDVEVPLGSWDTEQMTKITAKTAPVFYVQRAGAYTIGTSACSAVKAGVVIVKDDVRFRPAADLPCTIAITKVYPENFGTGPEAIHAHALHMRERTIVVGTVQTQVRSEAGATLDVRAAFVLPTQSH